MNIDRSMIEGHLAREKGFTLIELMIVIGISAIMTAISIPTFVDWRKNQNFRKTANEITSFLRETRSKAISKGVQHEILFNQVSNCYQLQVYNIATSSFDTPSQTLCPPADVSIKSSSDGTSTAVLTVIFNSDGTTTISGPDGLTSANVSVNDLATQKYLVTVLRTGRISSVRKY
jgi:prepilin-type N-terminal cleavage/methylation domain-containing protein